MIEFKELDWIDCIKKMDAMNVKGSCSGATYIINSINDEFWEWIMPIAKVHGHKLDRRFVVWYDCQDESLRLRGTNVEKKASTSMRISPTIMPPQLLQVFNELKKVKIKITQI